MVVMAHMQRHGHRPIALFGGGTGMIGDPTGKTDMRKMLTKEEIQHNIECFVKQMSTLIDFKDNKAIMVNNGDWLLDLNYIDFLREVGVHFSVNRMLAAECYKPLPITTWCLHHYLSDGLRDRRWRSIPHDSVP